MSAMPENLPPDVRESILRVVRTEVTAQMQTAQSNGWSEYRKLVLAELERAAQERKELREFLQGQLDRSLEAGDDANNAFVKTNSDTHRELRRRLEAHDVALTEVRVAAAKAGALYGGVVGPIVTAIIVGLVALVRMFIGGAP